MANDPKYISKLTIPDNTGTDQSYDIKDAFAQKGLVFYEEPTGTAGSGSTPYLSTKWQLENVEGTITTPYNGMRMIVKVPTAGVGTAGVILSIDNGQTWHPLHYNNSTLTTHYAVGTVVLVVYDSTTTQTAYPTAGTSESITGVWRCAADYDSNTTNISNILRPGGTALLKTQLGRYRLILSVDGETVLPFNSSNSTSATAAKTVTQEKFDPFGNIYFYNTSTVRAANYALAASAMNMQYYSASYSLIGYSYVTTLTANKWIFLKATMQSDGMAILNADTTTGGPIVQDLPTTDDGFIYIFLGYATSATLFTLHINHPIFYYKNGRIRMYTGQEDTDTTYTFADGTNSFTVTPSGGTAQTVNVTPSITDNALTTTSISGTVTGSTSTSAGTVSGTVGSPSITVTKKNVADALGAQNANTILAGPTSGNAANPSFRALTMSDLPSSVDEKVVITGSVQSMAQGQNLNITFTGDYAQMTIDDIIDDVMIPAQNSQKRLIFRLTETVSNSSFDLQYIGEINFFINYHLFNLTGDIGFAGLSISVMIIHSNPPDVPTANAIAIVNQIQIATEFNNITLSTTAQTYVDTTQGAAKTIQLPSTNPWGHEHRSYYTTGTATIGGQTVDVNIMYDGVAPAGSTTSQAVWTITTTVATLDGDVVSETVNTNQTWSFPVTPPVVPSVTSFLPIIYPTTASDVTSTSMSIKSSVSDGGLVLTERGFVYNTTGNPTISDTKVVCDLGVGLMEKKLENLTRNTQYYIRSYGENASGLVYGSELVQRTSNNPIPQEYQLVEYLENPGYSYINLNKTFALGCNAKLKVVHTAYNNFNTYLGAYSDTSGIGIHNILRIRNSNGQGINPCIGTTSSVILKQGLFPIGEIEEFEIGNFNNIISYKDTNINIQQNVSGGYSTLNLFLFSLNFGENVNYSHSFIGKMYYCLIVSDFLHTFDNPNLALYPVYRKSDSKPGMYDIVNNVFYTNQGTGEFTVGPDKGWSE